MPGSIACTYVSDALALGAGRACKRMSPPSQPDRHERFEADNVAHATLMQEMARGDRAAFGALYDRLSKPLYATARRILNDDKEAEDVIHDVFLALWEKSGEFDASRGHVFAWAVTHTRNRAIDRIRMRRRRSELLSQAAPTDLGYEESVSSDPLADNESSAAVRAAVTRLPADQQRALELAFFSGLTQQEIADQLKEPLGTIKARIRRGLFKLRDLLPLRA
jgi:RNA polymerase sigma-70 factor (ECF subfamily)